jgi:hypothetical protein
MNSTSHETRTATPAQVETLKTLCAEYAEFNVEAARETWTHLAHLSKGGSLTMSRASHEIQTLIDLKRSARRAAHVKANEPVPFIPAGRYAIDNNEGALAFYRVAVKNDVNTAVYVYASDEQRKLPAKAAAGVLRKLAATDLEAAGVRFGQETRTCWKCGKRLTREHTRAAGIGDECASKA